MRYNTMDFGKYIRVYKNENGLYNLEEVKKICENYKYVYKSSNQFKKLDIFDDTYSGYIFSDIYLEPNFFSFFNSINSVNGANPFRFLHRLEYYIALYNIKEKIEIL